MLMTLRDRFRAWRNRKLSDPAFQEWAATFPLTRPIARRRAKQLFDMATGFVHTQILIASIELGLFEALRDGPLPLAALARRIDMPLDGTERLARAAVALGLLQDYSGERFGLGEQGAALLGNAAVFSMIRHHAVLYEDLRDPVGLLRERRKDTHLARFWNYSYADHAAGAAPEAAAYSQLMADTQALISAEILNAYSFADHERLMDVGGGSGAFLCAAAKQAPSLQLTLCDLPAVAALAEKRFEQEGLSERAQTLPCNFTEDALPKNADIISLVRILHDHDDDVVRRLLSSIRAALPQGGRLLIAEPLAQTPGAESMGDAYFGLYLWAMGQGRPRSASELKGFLTRAGFSQAKLAATRRPILTQLIVAS
ncbi:MAG: methyltransferase [Hyphococcus sp.]